MFLTKIQNWLIPFARFRQKRTLYGINSSETFRTILECERARADRYRHSFSLVLFDVRRIDMDDEAARQLVHVLTQRKRSTDEMGWFDSRQIGVILTNTVAEGSQQFASDVCQKIAKNGMPPPFRISHYPSASSAGNTNPHSYRSQAVISEQSNDAGIPCKNSESHDYEISSETLEPLFGRRMPAWKRGVDIFASFILLIVLSPLFVLIAVLITIVSPGPVFFKQKRVGYGGKQFTMWKLRTMLVDADASLHQNRVREEITSSMPLRKLDEDHDPRIIPFGKILRQTGLDELPQLLNILRGEMSIVGPRPDPVYAVRDYEPWHKARLDVVPGVTGLWQVNGKNKTTFKEMIRLDIAYTRQRSFWVDVKIVLRTLPTIIDQVKGGLITEG